jgi:hypothetical protein
MCAPRRWTRSRVIAAARDWHGQHGRSPRAADWPAAGCPSSSTAVRLFPDGFDAMLAAAGLSAPPRRLSRWTPECIVGALQCWEQEHGQPPRPSNFTRATVDQPRRATVIARFGSFSRALEAAGVSSGCRAI